MEFLEPQWSFTDNPLFSLKDMKDCLIPCVLGAGYASSKTFWQELKGLEGLFSYGSDEVLISLKVWLSGGVCKLLPNVLIGHIYRETSPYKHYSEKRVYNRLFIGDALCPAVVMKKLCAIEKVKNGKCYWDAWRLYYQNYDNLKNTSVVFKGYVRDNFSKFERLNSSHKYLELGQTKSKDKFLQKCVLYVVSKFYKEKVGLSSGKLGIVILLYHYAEYSKNRYIKNLANSFLEECVEEMELCESLNIADGLLGLGWCLIYLIQNDFLAIDVNDILTDIDRKIMALSPCRVIDVGFEYGLGGIVCYVLCRLYDVQYSKKEIFSSVFLQELYEKSKDIIESNIYSNCPEVYVEFILYFEGKRQISSMAIYDILMLPGWNKYSKKTKDASLHGLSGMCLEFILSQNKRSITI